jgi:NAD(P)-dependent dehydrogenase (short-subunit alcohol dehydrogenase family)
MKSILITGTSTGIGFDAAVTLHQRGWRVFAGVRREEDTPLLRQHGIIPIILDMDSSASIDAAQESVLSQTNNRLDALFNNAGFGQPGAVEDLSRTAIRAQFETNVFGLLELTNKVIPIMRKQQRGRLVFNSSMLGIVALKYRGAYNASKFAMEGLVDTLRLELRGSGIQVSLIEPGPILSEFRKNAYTKFMQHIDHKRSVHHDAYQVMIEKFQHEGAVVPFTRDASAVTQKLIHALESKRPKAHYPVTVPAHAAFILRRILPTRLLDAISVKI